jgi:hypothetical protein
MEDIGPTIAIVGTFLVVLIPVAGLTARFALKPLIETFASVMQARRGDEALQTVERRVAQLEKELAAMRGERRALTGETEPRPLAAASAERPAS